jgi:hypothetical protein
LLIYENVLKNKHLKTTREEATNLLLAILTGLQIKRYNKEKRMIVYNLH